MEASKITGWKLHCILRLISYRTDSTMKFHYNDQSVQAVQGNNWCLLQESMNTECDENEELMLFRLGSKWLIIEQI